MSVRLVILPVILFGAAIVPVAGAQTTRPLEPVLQTLVQFSQALEMGNTEVLRRLIYVKPDSTDQAQALEILLQYLAARRQLYRMAVQRFPEDAQRLAINAEMVLGGSEDDSVLSLARARMEDASAVVDGVTARVIWPGESTPVLLRASPETEGWRRPRWQVILELIESVRDGPRRMDGPWSGSGWVPRRLRVLLAMTAAVQETIAALRKGQLSSVDAVELRLFDGFAEAHAQAHRPLQ